MNSVRVTAHVLGALALPSAPIHLDALIMWAAASKEGCAPTGGENRADPPSIPIPKDGGIFMCSAAMYSVALRGRRFLNRKYPLMEEFTYGNAKSPAINVGGGPTKITHKPCPIIFPVGGFISWVCRTDDVDKLLSLANRVTNLGRLASHGYGKVTRWSCDVIEAWDGFPCLLDGKPTRCLPIGYPGVLGNSHRAVLNVAPPYWDRGTQVECYVPETPC